MAHLRIVGSPGPIVPLDVLLATLPSLPRPILSRLTSKMIERLDEMDPDPDVEANGDELDGSMAEDDFHPQNNWRGEPGCPLSDPGEQEEDGDRFGHAEDQRVIVDEHGRVQWEADTDGSSRTP